MPPWLSALVQALDASSVEDLNTHVRCDRFTKKGLLANVASLVLNDNGVGALASNGIHSHAATVSGLARAVRPAKWRVVPCWP